MPRFVILRHQPGANSTRPLHWDFMLEQGDVLRTWSLEIEPRANVSIQARQLADHRLAYLDYEGEISSGRGNVEQWDSGTYEYVSNSQVALTVQLAGRLLSGAATLSLIETSPDNWRFQFSPDPRGGGPSGG